MGFILGFLGACIGIIVGIGIIIAFIYVKVRKTVGPANMKTLVDAAKNAKNFEQEEYTRHKNVSGITKLIEPTILKDFHDFNKELLYSKVEKNLAKIFTALEEKSLAEVKKDKELIYLYSTINDNIKDMEENNINIKYDEVKFHSHAIKDYLKSKGKATITISSSLEYYYKNDSENYKKKDLNNLKKQTRFTTQFVYVYDETQFKHNENAIVVSCSNCGAPLGKLGAGNCQYCGTYIEPINLKNWYMVSYKEDY